MDRIARCSGVMEPSEKWFHVLTASGSADGRLGAGPVTKSAAQRWRRQRGSDTRWLRVRATGLARGCVRANRFPCSASPHWRQAETSPVLRERLYSLPPGPTGQLHVNYPSNEGALTP